MIHYSTEVKDYPTSAQRAFTFVGPAGFNHPKTRIHVRLLGPWFKTGFKMGLWCSG